MSGRGAPAGRSRGRPGKVLKTAMSGRGRGVNNHASLTADHLEAHLARAAEEEEGRVEDEGEEVEGGEEVEAKDEDLVDVDVDADADEGDAQGHHDQHLVGEGGSDHLAPHHGSPFDMGHSPSAAAAGAHSLVANGPPGSQQGDADIHPALQGLMASGPGGPSDPTAGGDQPPQEGYPPMNTAPMGGDSASAADDDSVVGAGSGVGGGGGGAGGSRRNALTLAKESGYDDLVIDSALCKRLSGNKGVRHAVQRRQDQVLNLKRRSNVEALLAHVSGVNAHSPCKSCHKGYGPWENCVVVKGLMCGSCSNCWFNASGSRCSFHENNLPSQQQHVPAIQMQNNGAAPSAIGPFPGLGPNPAAAAAAAAAQLQVASLGGAPAPGTAPGAGAAGPIAGPSGFNGNIDHFARNVFERVLSECRVDDPHARFQFRIDAAARNLAVVVAEYNDFLAAEQQAQQHQQAEQEHHQHHHQHLHQQEDEDSQHHHQGGHHGPPDDSQHEPAPA